MSLSASGLTFCSPGNPADLWGRLSTQRRSGQLNPCEPLLEISVTACGAQAQSSVPSLSPEGQLFTQCIKISLFSLLIGGQRLLIKCTYPVYSLLHVCSPEVADFPALKNTQNLWCAFCQVWGKWTEVWEPLLFCVLSCSPFCGSILALGTLIHSMGLISAL